MKDTIGLYLHIPFCRSKCPYCDFCSFPHPAPAAVEDYLNELIRRVGRAGEGCRDLAVDTVYIGGGTPTVLSPAQAGRLTAAVHAAFDMLPDAEFTVEGNPAAGDSEVLAAYRAGGANRLSLGAQSARKGELKALGRLHDWDAVCRTVDAARATGFDNINLDFMLGIPGQTSASLRDTLEKALTLSPEHLSAYCLIIEEDTPFGRRGRAALGLPADEDTADEQSASLYEEAARILTGAGYEHYEISNYAREGFRSRHNLHTWQDREYLGLGLAAYSYFRGERFGQSRDLAAFLRGEDITVDRYTPDRAGQMEEFILLGLRTSDGIDEATFAARFGEDFWTSRADICRPWIDRGLMRRAGGRIRLTEAGWLVSNAIIAELI